MGFQPAMPSGERSEDKKLSQNPSHCFSVPIIGPLGPAFVSIILYKLCF